MEVRLMKNILFSAALLALPLVLTGCGAGGTAATAAAEAQAAKAAKKDMDSAKLQIQAAQKLQNERLKQAEQQ
jgi:outer membrane lipoprotein-sorting protein